MASITHPFSLHMVAYKNFNNNKFIHVTVSDSKTFSTCVCNISTYIVLCSDFLLLILKKLLLLRPDIRVILMSATMNAALFCEYFNDVPIIDIPGN